MSDDLVQVKVIKGSVTVSKFGTFQAGDTFTLERTRALGIDPRFVQLTELKPQTTQVEPQPTPVPVVQEAKLPVQEAPAATEPAAEWGASKKKNSKT